MELSENATEPFYGRFTHVGHEGENLIHGVLQVRQYHSDEPGFVAQGLPP